MEPRPILSEKDALILLNFELSAYEKCADCRFTSIRPVTAQSGCNRSVCRQVVDEVCGSFTIAAPARNIPTESR
ncbi:MAG TPA: hypothetical protein VFA36_06250 [Burkholderiales bacterium]|jgi:hypothetical protein|nr:hypothetical protein [Burkholderiales bacterium]